MGSLTRGEAPTLPAFGPPQLRRGFARTYATYATHTTHATYATYATHTTYATYTTHTTYNSIAPV